MASEARRGGSETSLFAGRSAELRASAWAGQTLGQCGLDLAVLEVLGDQGAWRSRCSEIEVLGDRGAAREIEVLQEIEVLGDRGGARDRGARRSRRCERGEIGIWLQRAHSFGVDGGLGVGVGVSGLGEGEAGEDTHGLILPPHCSRRKPVIQFNSSQVNEQTPSAWARRWA